MKVRTSHAPRGADFPDDAPPGHDLAGAHVKLRQVGKRREQTQSVVDDDGVSAEMQILASTAVPAFGALTTAPAALGKSAPVCELRI